MPSHPKRWGLLALLFVFLVTILTALPALAKNPYEMTDGSEGDPGDGVLKPSNPAIVSVRLPVVIRCYDATTDRTLWGLPVFVLPTGVSGVPMLLMLPMDAWTTAASGSWSGGRWPHAR